MDLWNKVVTAQPLNTHECRAVLLSLCEYSAGLPAGELESKALSYSGTCGQTVLGSDYHQNASLRG